MTADTPYRWLSVVASHDPDRPCLVDTAGAHSYGDVLDRVTSRAEDLQTQADHELNDGEIRTIEVALNIDSIIEILAVQHLGAVPFPHTGPAPRIGSERAPGAAICIATSGSSGASKVVPLSFANLEAAVDASRRRLGNGNEDRWLACLPLDHVGGLSVIWRTLQAGGSALVAPFDASGTVIDRFEPTIASMVPTMVRRLLDRNQDALKSIGSILVGGAGLDASLMERCRALGVSVMPTYGLTEAGSQVATATDMPPRSAAGYVGRPLDGMDVEIVNSDGETVELGDTGVISVAGPAVFEGYLGEETRQGRFVTSDLGWFDRAGNLYVEGRIDDVIVSGGENVSLVRVAETIGALDGVRDVCVVGLADSEWGMVCAAMVVSNLPLDSLDTMTKADLRRHERPKRWLRGEGIPLLTNGKHDRGAVRAAFEEEPWI